MIAESPIRRPAHRRFDSPLQEAFLGLWRTYDRLRALEEELFNRYDITAQQYNALRVLRAEHPGTLPTLVLQGRLVSRAPDITRLLDKLEKRGLIARERVAANRRVVQVTVTAEGLALLDRIEAPLAECHARQLGHMSPEDLTRLIELLHKVRRPHEDVESIWR